MQLADGQLILYWSLFDDGLFLLEGFFGLGIDYHLGAVGQGDDQIIHAPKQFIAGYGFDAVFAEGSVDFGVQLFWGDEVPLSFLNLLKLLLD